MEEQRKNRQLHSNGSANQKTTNFSLPNTPIYTVQSHSRSPSFNPDWDKKGPVADYGFIKESIVGMSNSPSNSPDVSTLNNINVTTKVNTLLDKSNSNPRYTVLNASQPPFPGDTPYIPANPIQNYGSILNTTPIRPIVQSAATAIVGKLDFDSVLNPQQIKQDIQTSHNQSNAKEWIDSKNINPSNVGDIFDFDYLGKISSKPLKENSKNVTQTFNDLAPDNPLGLLAIPNNGTQQVQKDSGSTKSTLPVAKQLNGDQFEMKAQEMYIMGFDKQAAANALLSNNLDLDTAVTSLKYEKTDDKDIEQLVKMGFNRQQCRKALEISKGNTQDALEILLSQDSSTTRQGSPMTVEDKSMESLMKIGFKKEECKLALETANGDVDHALEILLKQKSPKKVNFSESSFAIDPLGTVFSKAKDVFSFSKKKVGAVFNSSTAEINRKRNPELDENNWNNPQFKDALNEPLAGSKKHITEEGTIKNSVNLVPVIGETSKTPPYNPIQQLERKDSIELPLKHKKGVVNDVFNLLSENDFKENAFPPKSNSSNPIHTYTANPIPVFSQSKPKDLLIQRNNQLDINSTNVSVDTTIKLQADDLRQKGNDLFKQGQFADAENMYTKGIELLPHNSTMITPLYNNRAACKLKNGDYKGTIADCDIVFKIDPNDLKCLLRRATAYEALEDWNKAREDYRTIMGIDPNVKGCSAGLARCASALKPKDTTPRPLTSFNST